MVEFERQGRPSDDENPPSACIVGVGGAGSNVLDRITLDRTMEATLVSMHTDVRVLGHSMAPEKIQLGSDLMRGVGAGGDPDLGREAALFSRDDVRKALADHDMIFICAGLGGGTGSGAAPVIAEIAKASGALVVVVATMPFRFEGRRRIGQAEEALELLQQRADALILFDNDRMGELILPKDGIQKAFSSADQLIAQSLRAVSTLISTPGLVKLGLDDLTSSLRSSNGRCLFGFGEAKGKSRGDEALKKALRSPLIDQGKLLHQTKNLLVHVAGGEGLTLIEVEDIMKKVGRHVPDDTQILFGVAADRRLGESVAVTLISSLDAEALAASSAVTAEAKRPTKPKTAAKPRPKPAPAVEPEPEPEPVFEIADPEPEPEGEAEVVDAAEEETVESAAVEEAEATEGGAEAPEPPPLDLFGEEVQPEAEESPEVSDDIVAEPEVKGELPDEVTIPDEKEEDPEMFGEDFTPEPEVVAPEPETAAVPLPDEEPEDVQAEVDETPAEEPEAVESKEEDAGGGLLASVINKPGASTESASDDMFQQGDQERGRFKNTEPNLVEGEDLDVPTWMRLKRKMKR